MIKTDPFKNLKPMRMPAVHTMRIRDQFDFDKVIVLFGWPILTVIAIVLHVNVEGFNAALIIPLIILGIITQLSLAAGYHRYFSHRSYEASAVIEFLYLFFGAGGFQNSALKWANDHRRHHRYSDREQDPHNGRLGFWHCHIGWILGTEKRRHRTYNVKDWEENKMVIWQHKNYYFLWSIQTFGLPLVIGLAMGSPIGGVALCGMLKSLYLQHATFLINSWGHAFGTRHFDSQASATDSLLLNFLVLGEGNHGFHHAFPKDYRTGYHWYSWDPCKWWLNLLALLGFVWNRHTTPTTVIEKRLFECHNKTGFISLEHRNIRGAFLDRY